MAVSNRLVTGIAIGGGILSILSAFSLGSVIFTVIAALLFLISLVVWKYGHILIPAITKATNFIEVRDGYEISPTRDYIIKKSENGYYASKFLEIRFYESTMDKQEEQKTSMIESFERAISSLKYIVKISLLISAVDLSKHIDDIKTKRGSAESKKSKIAKEGSDEGIRTDREIAMWNRLLDRITHGERPVEVIAYASTTSFGLTKEEAVAKVRRQAKEIRTILSSTLGCDIVEMVDLDMVKCFEWDKFFPATQEELRDELF
ncbi:MAG: hypothetical protein Q7S22_08205 [Candidatus Micrarchaeota archaeon]|nr:hypothetical protein [Candidatus Micrarchaeota archaeon]